MNATPYKNINNLLQIILSEIQNILGKKLVGLYLYGSLVTGDFDLKVSDIDLLAVLESDINDEEFKKLQEMHEDFAKEYKVWDNRIEVQYLSKLALKTFKTKKSKVAVISPGEPFHIKIIGRHWLINWYMVQEKGQTLFGPSPKLIIDPISKAEFLKSNREHVKNWAKWVKDMRSRKAQSYAILTMCRALYADKNSEHVSKKQAAIWTQKQLPEWSQLIQNALVWREAGRNVVGGSVTYPQTEKFVHYVINLIVLQ